MNRRYLPVLVLIFLFLFPIFSSNSHAEEVQDIDLSDEAMREWLKVTYDFADGVDELLDMALDESPDYAGSQFTDIFKALKISYEIGSYLSEKEYDKASLLALKYTAELSVKNTFVGSQLSSIASIANLAALPIGLSLNYFKNEMVRTAKNNQIKLYIIARKLGYSHAFIMNGAGDGNVIFTDDGWIYNIVDENLNMAYKAIDPVEYEPDEVYTDAQMKYVAEQALTTLVLDKQKLGDDLKNLIYPQITYTPSAPKAPAKVSFDVNGLLLDKYDIVSFTWDFGDGSTASGKSVSHVFRKPQQYNVTLEVIDSSGTKYNYDRNILIRSHPICIEYPDGYESLRRTFSTTNSEYIKTFEWDFGDDSPKSAGREQEHTYEKSDYYTVTLTLSLDDGSAISSTQGIFVGPGTKYIKGHTITGDETWFSGGEYIVLGSITVAKGGKLTIQPNTKIYFKENAYLNINGSLIAENAYLTNADTNSEWIGIKFYNCTENSKIENCIIENTRGRWESYNPTSQSAIGIYKTSSVKIIDCLIKQSTAKAGIWIDKESSPVITDNEFKYDKIGIWICYDEDTNNNPILQNNIFFNSSESDYYISGNINADAKWDDIATYYISSAEISEEGKLRIAPGSTLKFRQGGHITIKGVFQAEDLLFTWMTENEPWGGIRFSSDSENSYLKNCVIEHAAGSNYYKNSAIYIHSALSGITDCVIKNCPADVGIWIQYASEAVISKNTISGFSDCGIVVSEQSSPSIKNNFFSDNNYALRIKYSENIKNNPIIAENEFEKNSEADYYIFGDINADAKWDDIATYYIPYIEIEEGKLRIAPGSTLKFRRGGHITIKGVFQAEDLLFTWMTENEPWGGIRFSSDSENSYLKNCVIEHAAGSNYYKNSATYIHSALSGITDCVIKNCPADVGIWIQGASEALISKNTISGFPKYGIYIGNTSYPIISNNLITKNDFGIYCTGNQTINAQHNDWGDPSGPYDPSDDRASGGLYNPDGKGDRVSDNIDYEPWGILSVEKGDVNGKDSITLEDAILALQICTGINPDAKIYPESDVNDDGKIGLEDVVYTLRTVSDKN
ncbi:hypothetical protein DENIS_4627 [Desulfonema ishimotonii]|uniref:Probable pectate lyase C n=1 Tax=Desulfonema ishimotonii TaxID=45657 RepID=A0A401G307_9BACT|nr:right-handed parallel beta-helix repeat-containing protein [Desulfonema ishimotonii]GBC63629.1 hypothetical protein DENIS_4627 [Desulfonema ishimotonii]